MTDKELMEQALDALNLELPSGAYLKLRDALRGRLAQPEQEPVAWANREELGNIKNFDGTIYANGGFDDAVPLYTTPPQRKPLTDEQKMALCKQFPDHLTFNAIHAIEAEHGIKP